MEADAKEAGLDDDARRALRQERSVPILLDHRNEVAALVAFLLSDEAPFITGGAYAIDGGELA